MQQPKGFIEKTQHDFVCRLHKSLYGLKQAPRAWFRRLSQQLTDYGFLESSVDTSLFIYTKHGLQIFILVYVDDIIVTGSDQ